MNYNEQKTFPVFISSDSGEEVHVVDLYVHVEGGNADGNPYPVAVFEDMQGAGTVGAAVSTTQIAYGDPWDTTSDQAGDGVGSTGYQPAFELLANAASGQNADFPASGVLAYITWDSTGVPFGVYAVSLSSTELGETLVAKTGGALELGVDYFLDDGWIEVSPEPSSLLLGGLGFGGVAWLAYRRHRARPGRGRIVPRGGR
jgi:hypothetical protein